MVRFLNARNPLYNADAASNPVAARKLSPIDAGKKLASIGFHNMYAVTDWFMDHMGYGILGYATVCTIIMWMVCFARNYALDPLLCKLNSGLLCPLRVAAMRKLHHNRNLTAAVAHRLIRTVLYGADYAELTPAEMANHTPELGAGLPDAQTLSTFDLDDASNLCKHYKDGQAAACARIAAAKTAAAAPIPAPARFNAAGGAAPGAPIVAGPGIEPVPTEYLWRLPTTVPDNVRFSDKAVDGIVVDLTTSSRALGAWTYMRTPCGTVKGIFDGGSSQPTAFDNDACGPIASMGAVLVKSLGPRFLRFTPSLAAKCHQPSRVASARAVVGESAASTRWWEPATIISYCSLRNPDAAGTSPSWLWVESYSQWKDHFDQTLADPETVGELFVAVVNTVSASLDSPGQEAGAVGTAPGMHWFVVAWRVLATPAAP